MCGKVPKYLFDNEESENRRSMLMAVIEENWQELQINIPSSQLSSADLKTVVWYSKNVWVAIRWSALANHNGGTIFVK